MPRRALRCVVDLHVSAWLVRQRLRLLSVKVALHTRKQPEEKFFQYTGQTTSEGDDGKCTLATRCIPDENVSAPGVWLPSKEPVYLSISLFNQYRNTACHDSVFPVLINEKFRFEKTYYTAVDPAQVAEILEDELIIFELVQLSEYTDGAVRLASYSTNARDFLYPYPCLAPSYSSHDREILMCRTIAFPGISPKLEFSTKTVIKESASSALDALQDCEELERKSRRSSRTRRSLSRSPSPTVRRKLADISLDDTIDPRPPFVVRKLDDSLIGRIPSSSTEKHAKSRAKRSASPQRPRSSSALDSLNLSTSSKPRYHLTKVIRNPYEEPLPVFKPQYTSTYDNDIDREVEELTSMKPTYVSTRPRSVSPFLYRRSFRDRYGDSLYSPPYSSSYYDSLYERELERARTRRLARLYSSYYNSLDDLDLELRLARIRAARY